jgi:hypothetical protein
MIIKVVVPVGHRRAGQPCRAGGAAVEPEGIAIYISEAYAYLQPAAMVGLTKQVIEAKGNGKVGRMVVVDVPAFVLRIVALGISQRAAHAYTNANAKIIGLETYIIMERIKITGAHQAEINGIIPF